MKTPILTLTSCLVAGSIADAAAPFGAADLAFNAPRFTSRCYPNYCRSDGRGGLIWSFVNVRPSDFIGANWVRVGGLVRTTESGVLDTNFVVGPALQEAFGTAVQTDGKILVGARMVGDVAYNGAPNYRVYRILTNGVLDTTYRSPVFGYAPRFMTVQPDGKLLAAYTDLADTFPANGGIGGIVRLNTDGSQEAAFTPPALTGGTGSGVMAPPVVDTNGMIYLAGGFTQVNGQARQGVARLYPNGDLDYGFVPSGYTFSSFVRGVLLQTGGKVVIAGRLRVSGNTTYYPLMRLNSDGSFDNTFTLVTATSLNFNRARLLTATSEGKMLTVSHTMARFNNDGSLDTSFIRLPFGDAIGDTSDIYRECYWFTQLADGRLVVPNDPTVSVFPATINGQPYDGSVRLWPNGTLDPAYSAPVFQSESFPTVMSRQNDGKLLAGGYFDQVGAIAQPSLARLNTNGTPDTTYTLAVSNATSALSLAPLQNNQTYAVLQTGDWMNSSLTNVLVRLQPDGTPDQGFNADAASMSVGYNEPPDLLLQGTLPIVVGSRAQALLYQTNIPVVRLQTNGDLDSDFHPNLPMSGKGVFSDGSPITNWAKATINNIGQLFVGDIQLLSAMSDGRLICASGTTDGSSCNYQVIRLNVDGSLDGYFTGVSVSSGGTTIYSGPSIQDRSGNFGQVGAVYPVRCLAGALVQSNGTVLIGGTFTNVNGVFRPGIARLKVDSTFDPAFPVAVGPATAGGVAPVRISGLSAAGAGRVWVTGNFIQWDGIPAQGLVRLNADGSVDRSCLPQASFFALEDYYQTVFSGALPGTSLVSGEPDDCLVFGSHLLPGDVWPRALSRLVAYPPPSLRSAGMLSGFGYGMTLATLPGQDYRMQFSSDLKTWQDWFTFIGDGTTKFVSDSASTNALQKFYRAQFHP